MQLPALLLDSRKTLWSWVGFLLIGIVGVFDYLTGYELAFSLFYLIPVSIVAWFGSNARGVLASLVSSATWIAADVGAGHHYSHPAIYVWNSVIRFSFFLIVGALLTAVRQMLEHERELARCDYLTGALNSRSFHELLSAEISRLARYGHAFSVAYIDLDNFKPVNDKHGHAAGDMALRTVVERAKRNLRRTDVFSRLGGDEFALLMPETDSGAARIAVSKLRKALLAAMAEHGWPITFSIGVLTCTEAPSGPDEVIRVVDDLMYRAKHAGKDGAQFEMFRGMPAEAAS